MDVRVKGRGNETRVILQPCNRPNWAAVRLKGVIYRILRSVEVVDVDEVDEHASEEMTTVREYYFATLLD